MSDEKENTTATVQPKYSRYKSVRHTIQPTPVATPEERKEEAKDVSRTKSMSRYRRSRGPVKEQQVIPEAPVPAIPSSMLRANTVAARKGPPASGHPVRTAAPRRVTDPTSRPSYANAIQEDERLQQTEDERMRRKVREFQERNAGNKYAEENENPQQLRRAGNERAQNTAAMAEEEISRPVQLKRTESEADQARRIEEENASILAEQKRRDLERLQRELDAAVPLLAPPSKIQSATSPLRSKFSFFSRKKESKPVISDKSKDFGLKPSPDISGVEAPRTIGRSRLVDAPVEMKRPKDVEKSQQIMQGGGGIVPQTDAPISASNAGERRVLVRCIQSSINLPITPETTPFDIIYSAANIMTQDIDPSTAVLVEAYAQLGLDRRLRRYEHVRDIMNSWDRDTQNCFEIQSSFSPKSDKDLDVVSVPEEVPSNVTVYMYHSQKPGKWNKRYVTLLSSGQIYMSKHEGTKSSEKDAMNLCHLSDFDIYTPTPQQIRKVLKPPKRHCHAIKSQQKTSMFLSTENFVHFFSSDNEQLARKWYAAVQGWRSWYLVNRMGEGRKRSAKKDESRTKTLGHAAAPSVEQVPYTIGSFAPLFDTKRPESSERSDDGNNKPRNSMSLSSEGLKRNSSRRHPPAVVYKVPSNQEPEFASAGLLGRTYSTRQRELQQHANNNSNIPQNNDGRTPSMGSVKRPTTSGEGLARAGSLRSIPKPLLDFTPQFKEAPQWDRTGKGRGVAAVNGLPLVETATTPATGTDGILPRSTVFRREEPTRLKTGVSARPKTGRADSGNDGFVEGGLLSKLDSRVREKERGLMATGRARAGYE